MSKHTKGSWEVLDFGDGPQVDADTGPVAVLVGFRKTRLANARLIAAAPELLNLAKQIVPMIRSGQYAILCDFAEIVIEQAESGTKK